MAKTLALRDLAAKTLDGTVPTLAQTRRMTDAGFNDFRARLTDTLEREVMRAYAEDLGEAPHAA